MIIHRVSATNVLAYEQLELTDLPEEGIIAISGSKSSGKSSIVETICFGLFGRVPSLKPDELNRIIHHGKTDCSVTIRFSNNKINSQDSEVYALTRTLDKEGHETARLYKAYFKENILAEGVDSVKQMLLQLTLIDYKTFIQFFYLTQKEMSSPIPYSDRLKNMAGVSTMEQCFNDIDDEMEELNKQFIDHRQEIKPLKEESTQLFIKEGHLDSLQEKCSKTEQKKALSDKNLADYKAILKNYRAAGQKHQQLLNKKRRLYFWRFLFLFFAVIPLIIWPFLTNQELINQELTNQGELIPYLPLDFLPDIPYPVEQPLIYLLFASGCSILMSLIIWLSIFRQKGNIPLHKTGLQLKDIMQTTDDSRNNSLNDSPNNKVNKSREILKKNIISHQVKKKELYHASQEDLEFLKFKQDFFKKRMADYSNALANEQKRIKRANNLKQQIAQLESRMNEIETQYNVRKQACELLIGSTGDLSRSFNQILEEYADKSLILFSENHFCNVQIDDRLVVQVFSNEDEAFIELDDLSDDLQQQIMLSVWVALTQEMLNRRSHKHQFIVFDEPFARSDKDQNDTLRMVLPKLKDSQNQIWIVARNFPEEMSDEYTISCE